MFAPRHDFFRALREARRATRRGDHASADRWTRLAERLQRLAAPRQAPATRSGPVILDPDGFSPGGTPNWFLNQKRRERAGIRQAPDARFEAGSAVRGQGRGRRLATPESTRSGVCNVNG